MASERLYNFQLAVTIPKDILRIGFIKGATIMAPIITAALLA